MSISEWSKSTITLKSPVHWGESRNKNDTYNFDIYKW